MISSNNKKTIVIDARCVTRNQNHGIARYTAELVEQIAATACDDIVFVLLVNKGSPYLNEKLPKHIAIRLMRFGWISAPGQIELAYILWTIKPSLHHSPSFWVSLLSNTPFIATIHDLIHVKREQEYTLFHAFYYRFLLKWKIKAAKAIITVSTFSKNEIVEFYKLQPERVHVIYNGISQWFRKPNPCDNTLRSRFCSKYEIPTSYILSAGNKKSHKNIAGLVRAWCEGGFSEPLVLLSEFDEELLHISDKYNKRHCLFFLRYIPDHELPTLYSLAKIFVYPSLYEGFGFPPLEAAACEVPVVVSNRASLPEVMQNCATYVNPEKTEEIIHGMREALSQNDTTRSSVSEGLKLVESYTWPKAGQQTLKIYRHVLGIPTGGTP